MTVNRASAKREVIYFDAPRRAWSARDNFALIDDGP